MHPASSSRLCRASTLDFIITKALQILPYAIVMHSHYVVDNAEINLYNLGSTEDNIDGTFKSLNIAAPNELIGKPNHYFKKVVTMSIL
jgi:hypothetical protein